MFYLEILVLSDFFLYIQKYKIHFECFYITFILNVNISYVADHSN